VSAELNVNSLTDVVDEDQNIVVIVVVTADAVVSVADNVISFARAIAVVLKLAKIIRKKYNKYYRI
jgi:hypothetical protein